MIKKEMVVYHIELLKRMPFEQNPTFKVLSVDDDFCKVEIVAPGIDPFETVGKTWTNIPVNNLIDVNDYDGSYDNA